MPPKDYGFLVLIWWPNTPLSRVKRRKLSVVRGFRFQSANIEKSQKLQKETSRDFARLENVVGNLYRRLSGPRQFKIFTEKIHDVLTSVLKRDSIRASHKGCVCLRCLVRSRGSERHVHWSRADLGGEPARCELSTMRSMHALRLRDNPEDILPASPWRSRRRINARENSLREQVVRSGCESWGHPAFASGPPRPPAFVFPFLFFSLSLSLCCRSCLRSERVRSPELHEEEEYTSVRELFAKRTEKPGGRFAGDVVPPRVRFPDGHAPRSALSEGGCRRHRRRRRCRRCCCCSRRCIHYRKVIATGGVAEGHLPTHSMSLLFTTLNFAFHRRLRRFDYHRIKYL